jgi:hypothetical protein
LFSENESPILNRDSWINIPEISGCYNGIPFLLRNSYVEGEENTSVSISFIKKPDYDFQIHRFIKENNDSKWIFINKLFGIPNTNRVLTGNEDFDNLIQIDSSKPEKLSKIINKIFTHDIVRILKEFYRKNDPLYINLKNNCLTLTNLNDLKDMAKMKYLIELTCMIGANILQF